MNYPDPFTETNPLWQRYAGPPDADLAQSDHSASDFYNFLREQTPPPKSERQLPRGVTLNKRDSGEWVLTYPAGGVGYLSMTGTREDLMKVVEKMR